jgi:hypothetical protein
LKKQAEGTQKIQRSFAKNGRKHLPFGQNPSILGQIVKIFSGDKMLQILTELEF